MGTMTPPPAPIVDSHASTERSAWGGPVLLVAAVALIGWGAYRAGHRASLPTETPKAEAEVKRIVPVLQVQAPPASAPTAIPVKTAPEKAHPTAPRAYIEERRGVGITIEAKGGPSADLAASLGAMQAEEKQWRDRATAARGRLAKAQDDYNKISDANPLIQLRDGGISAAALGSRNAALSPYQLELDTARADLEGLPEACRKAGCQPGWIR